MRVLTKILLSFAFSAIFVLNVNAEEAKKIDPNTGLIVAKGMQTVVTNCTVCHSAKFIVLQKGDRRTWKDMIVWMQETQGLWQFDAATEKTILDYLATNYAPGDRIERRKNLPRTSLPVNPYSKMEK